MEVVIQKSRRKDKKLDAVIDGKKTISFGAAGMSDFTLHKDDDRKERYIARRRKNEHWRAPKTAGFYSQHILWNKPTLQASVNDLNKGYNNIVSLKEIIWLSIITY